MRVKNQKYCRKQKCQKARRAKWQRLKMQRDPVYREEKKRCESEWQKKHPEYWREYREKHPDYVARNRLEQCIRDAKRRKHGLVKMLAKPDSLRRSHYSRKGGLFRMIPQSTRMLAKLDSLTVKLVPIQDVRRT